MNTIPNLRVVVGACILAIAGYSVFSAWAVFYSGDAALRGDVIGTWKSFAVMAFGFWLGSSSGGKAAAAPHIGPNERGDVNAPATAEAGIRQAGDGA